MSSNILNLPTGKNKKLKAVMDLISEDVKLQAYWKCANVMAIDRIGYSDHGPVHMKIVANSALKILRILFEHKVTPSIVKDYSMTAEDAEVIVVLASVLHDLGMVITRENHEEYSLFLALGFLESYLGAIYTKEQTAIMSSEVLHAISSHRHEGCPLTVEAGIIRIADALDMEQGRARIPFEAGKIGIHSVSALSIERVKIEKGVEKPITIRIWMTSSAGIFQIDQLLRNKINNSGLEDYIHVIAIITGEKETKVIEKFEI